ncbi:MAG: NHLP bacteriocin export ABC transporter permease/ATPase subunit [Vicingaceae bacterium]
MDKLIEGVFKEVGRELKLDVSKPFLANDSNKVWLITEGSINLSGTKVINDEAVGKVQDFATIGPGHGFFGIRLKDYNSLCFLASPQGETTLFELSIDALKAWSEEKRDNVMAFDGFIRDWVTALYKGIEAEGSKPLVDHNARPGWTGNVDQNHILSTKQNVVWFECSNMKALLFNDLIELDNDDVDLHLPISRYGYIRATEDVQIVAEAEEQVSIPDEVWKGLIVFHDLVMDVELVLLNREADTERERLIRKHQLEDEEVALMLEKAKAILTSAKADPLQFDGAKSKSAFYNACTVVAAYMKMELILPPNLDKAIDPLAEISRYSSVRYRELFLEGDWYKNDGGPFLAFLKEGEKPVAVLPLKRNTYVAIDPESKERFKITEENFQDFKNFGYMFFKPMPIENLSVKELFKYSIDRDKTDYLVILAMALVVTLLGMLTPILMAILFDSIIPNATKNQLVYVAFGLTMAAIGAFLFDLTKSIALLRAESKMDQKIQSGVWDRLLNLPTTFFRDFTAGDLAMRSLSIGQIRRLLSGVVLTSLLSAVFSSLNLVLLFYFSPPLAWIAILLVGLQVAVNYTAGRMQVKKQKVLLAQSGKTAGIVLQLLTGIAKFRVTGTERRAFNHWMKNYLPVKDIGIGLKKIQNFTSIFNRHFQLISMMVIFIMMVSMTESTGMSIGEFLSFSAAYGIFAGSLLSLSGAMISILQIGPLYDRTKPILESLPENSSTKESPGPLKGNIELNDIDFRYDADGPYILKDLSMNIKSGDYIALVGPSGSGKSTMIRLLLGFNQAESGAIFFDGQDLAHLDPRMVRQQIGVVLQDGSLVAGDIFSNIIGSSTTLTLKDAWAAAKAAAFDKDIESMPMGMHTVVSESGGTISGGQKQRLMIARALVHRPNILIFDEATSALDNHTQAIVSASLDQLDVTRIVVAHRLTTILNADTIYYLEGGNIIEKGSYEELMALEGKFYELAKRQLE